MSLGLLRPSSSSGSVRFEESGRLGVWTLVGRVVVSVDKIGVTVTLPKRLVLPVLIFSRSHL